MLRCARPISRQRTGVHALIDLRAPRLCVFLSNLQRSFEQSLLFKACVRNEATHIAMRREFVLGAIEYRSPTERQSETSGGKS
jgi:hypothetical protein